MTENEPNPLFLPKGSVRAIIAIMLVGTLCYMGVSNAEYVMPDWLLTLISAVIGFYFGNRGKEQQQK